MDGVSALIGHPVSRTLQGEEKEIKISLRRMSLLSIEKMACWCTVFIRDSSVFLSPVQRRG
jgi:hypothetical protein